MRRTIAVLNAVLVESVDSIDSLVPLTPLIPLIPFTPFGVLLGSPFSLRVSRWAIEATKLESRPPESNTP